MSWLLPIGTPAGICSGFEGVADGSGFVNLGDERINLDANLYRLWRAASAVAPADELLAWAATEGIPATTEDIRTLVDAGLLLEEAPDSEARIGALAVQLTGECMGNGADRRTEFDVVGRDGARIGLDVFSYEVLLRSDGATAISDICQELEETSPSLPSGVCLRTIAAGLPLLVRCGVVRADLRRHR